MDLSPYSTRIVTNGEQNGNGNEGAPFLTAISAVVEEEDDTIGDESEVSGLVKRRGLPRGANMATIIDTVLRDAPFTEYLRGTWHKLLQKPAYYELSTNGFWWLLSHIIEPRDRGADVRLELEDQIQTTRGQGQLRREHLEKAWMLEDKNKGDENFGYMAISYVSLFRSVPSNRKDYFLHRFFEIMAYTMLLLVSAAYPKRHDAITEDIGLKRYVINLCAEWTTGVRPRNIPDDHWVIKGRGDSDGFRSRRSPGSKISVHTNANGGGTTSRSAPRSTDDTIATRSISSAHTRGIGRDTSVLDAEASRNDSSEPRVRNSFTFENSPFFRYYLAVNDTRSTTVNRVSLTVNASRLPSFLAHHVPIDQQDYAKSTVRIGLRSAHTPFPAQHVLTTSRETRRAVLDAHRRQQQEASKSSTSSSRERRRVTAAVEARQKAVLNSDTLREYATQLAANTKKPCIIPHSTGPRPVIAALPTGGCGAK